MLLTPLLLRLIFDTVPIIAQVRELSSDGGARLEAFVDVLFTPSCEQVSRWGSGSPSQKNGDLRECGRV